MSERGVLLLRKQLKGPPRCKAASLPPHPPLLRPPELSRNPIEGFSAGLVDDANWRVPVWRPRTEPRHAHLTRRRPSFEWAVTIMGPPETYLCARESRRGWLEPLTPSPRAQRGRLLQRPHDFPLRLPELASRRPFHVRDVAPER